MKNRLILPTNLTCGYFDCSTFGSLKVSPKRKCATFEIEYFLEDGKNTYSDNVAYPIRRNWVLICAPGEERYSELPFKTKYVKFFAEGKLAEILSSSRKYFHVYRTFEAISLLDEIITHYTTKSWDEIFIQGKLLSYISLILGEADLSQTDDFYKRRIIVTAQTYMKAHASESIKLSDIAKEVNLTPNYFHTLFSESCGITPREYLLEQRLIAAKKYLLTTQLSLSEIAERCGFKNQQYMSSVLKAEIGCTPLQFRLQHQNSYLV